MVCKFSTFFSGIECGLILSNVKCFIEAWISGVVVAHNLDLNAFIVFVLARINFFFNSRIFVVDMFSFAIMDEACSATNILLIAPSTRKLVHFFFNS